LRSVYAKEMLIYFSSPIFYAVSFIFLCVLGIFFYNDMAYMSMLASRIAQYQLSTGLGLDKIVLRPLFSDMSILLLFIVPIIAMRLYSEEKANGTIELVFTYPITDLQVLLGKYLAGLSVIAILLGITTVLMLLAGIVVSPDWGLIFSSYLGLFLVSASFLAIGVFASSLTKNQIIAAASSLGIILAFWAVGWFSDVFTASAVAKFLGELGIMEHLDDFMKGMLNVKDAVFYLLFSLFFLFMTLRILESHTWRG